MNVKQAIVLNNTAAIDLSHGNLTEAVRSLHLAIEVLRGLSAPPQNNPSSIQEIPGTKTTSPMQEHQPSHQQYQDESMWTDGRAQSNRPIVRFVPVELPRPIDQDAQDSVIFYHAVFLDSDVTVDDNELLSSSVLFNMALSFHIKGFMPNIPRKEGESRNVCINRALQLYMIVLRVLDMLPEVSPSSELLVLGALNNAAQIHSLSFDLELVHKHADAMDQILASSVTCENDQVKSLFAVNAHFFRMNQNIAPSA